MTELDSWKSSDEKLEEYINNYNNHKSTKDGVSMINVSIGDIIGIYSEAKLLWDSIKLKGEKLTQCNITKEAGRGLGMTVSICVARANRSKVPITLKQTGRPLSYNVPHSRA
jgi:hypothetical protein